MKVTVNDIKSIKPGQTKPQGHVPMQVPWFRLCNAQPFQTALATTRERLTSSRTLSTLPHTQNDKQRTQITGYLHRGRDGEQGNDTGQIYGRG